jgi:4-hydroxy-tetrahydrodipicolinate synthase
VDAFGRILTAMITPMKENGEVDFDSAAKLACHLVETGSEGIVVSGTTGESPVLSSEEKCQLLKVVREAVSGKASVIAGTGSNDTAATIELTKEAEKVGCDGIMLVTPYYNKPSQEGLYQHFKAVASETGLPIILYNVPGRTSTNMLPVTVARLAEIENIVAVKEASGSLEQEFFGKHYRVTVHLPVSFHRRWPLPALQYSEQKLSCHSRSLPQHPK